MIPFRDNIPSRRYPVVTCLLIAANVAVFLFQLTLSDGDLQKFVFTYGVVPARLHLIADHPLQALNGTVVSVFASIFLHAGWLHLIGNMWYLWVFGDNVEDRMGRPGFLAFYFLCGAAASLIHIAFNVNSRIPSVGASGAIAGVLGAYLLSYPFARVLTLVPFIIIWPVIELPALLVLGSWFLIQLLNGWGTVAATTQTGGVAWWAHIGGFVAGMILLGVFAQRRRARRHTWEEEY